MNMFFPVVKRWNWLSCARPWRNFKVFRRFDELSQVWKVYKGHTEAMEGAEVPCFDRLDPARLLRIDCVRTNWKRDKHQTFSFHLKQFVLHYSSGEFGCCNVFESARYLSPCAFWGFILTKLQDFICCHLHVSFQWDRTNPATESKRCYTVRSLLWSSRILVCCCFQHQSYLEMTLLFRHLYQHYFDHKRNYSKYLPSTV